MQATNYRTQLASLSDGIFAVAMTLLAADITLPPEQTTVPAALTALWPQLEGLVLSFGVAALYWMNHHRRLGRTAQVGPGLLRVNLVFLLAVVLLPIATRLVSRLPGGTGVVLYGITLSLLAALNLLLWMLARRAAQDVEHIPLVSAAWATLAFILGTGAAFWSANLASVIWYLAVLGAILDRKLARRA